jgi:hypothetical protein
MIKSFREKLSALKIEILKKAIENKSVYFQWLFNLVWKSVQMQILKLQMLLLCL